MSIIIFNNACKAVYDTPSIQFSVHLYNGQQSNRQNIKSHKFRLVNMFLGLLSSLPRKLTPNLIIFIGETIYNICRAYHNGYNTHPL